MPTRDSPVVKCCVEMSNNVTSLLDPNDNYSRKEGYKFDRSFVCAYVSSGRRDGSWLDGAMGQ